MAQARLRSAERSGYESTLDSVQVERGVRGLRIMRPWSKGAGYAMLAWTAVWFGLVSFFLSLGHQPGWGYDFFMALPGIAMAYAAMTRFFNHTLIEVDALRLTVRHGPLPWPGNKRFARRDVCGLHAEVRKVHAKGNSIDECWIFIVRSNGRKSALLKGLQMSDLQMEGIAVELSEYLDVPLTTGRE